MEFQSGAVRPVESISEGWNLIKNNYWTFFLMILVAVVILIAVSFVLGLINNLIALGIAAALGVATTNSGDAVKISASIAPQLISMVISIFTNIIVITLSGAFFCGIYTALARQSSSGIAEFGDLFAGFQKIQACFIYSLVMSVIQFVIGLVVLLTGSAIGVSAAGLLSTLIKDGKLNPAVFGGLFLVILIFVVISLVINLIISALTAFVYPLIAERNLSGGEALLLSAKSGLANIGGLILLLILLGLMGIGGLVLCLVGFLFVAPVLSAAMFAAYQSVFGRTGGFYQQNPPPPPNFGNQRAY